MLFSLLLASSIQTFSLPQLPSFFLPSHPPPRTTSLVTPPTLQPSPSSSLLVVGGAALPLAGVVHARRADGAGDEVSGARGHEVSHCRRDVHPLVCHQVICEAQAEKTKATKGETTLPDGK